MRVVRLATRRPDASNGSITEVTHSRGLAPFCSLLEDNSLFIPHFLSVAFDYTFFSCTLCLIRAACATSVTLYN